MIVVELLMIANAGGIVDMVVATVVVATAVAVAVAVAVVHN